MHWYKYNSHKGRVLKNWRVADLDGDEICTIVSGKNERKNAALIAALPDLLVIVRELSESVSPALYPKLVAESRATLELLRISGVA